MSITPSFSRGPRRVLSDCTSHGARPKGSCWDERMVLHVQVHALQVRHLQGQGRNVVAHDCGPQNEDLLGDNLVVRGLKAVQRKHRNEERSHFQQRKTSTETVQRGRHMSIFDNLTWPLSTLTSWLGRSRRRADRLDQAWTPSCMPRAGCPTCRGSTLQAMDPSTSSSCWQA